MTLTKYQKVCYRIAGNIAEKKVNEKFISKFSGAQLNLRAGAYLSIAIMNALLAFIALLGIMLFFLTLMVYILNIQLDLMVVFFLLLIPVMVGGSTYGIYKVIPGSRAKSRARKININLAYALNFIAAMSSAGVTPTEIFKSLSKQDIYGDIKDEAASIHRDVALLGNDILTAIKRCIDRTPSQKFKEFLQGMIVTVTSGGSLKNYFMTKADQYMWENRQMQKQMLETLGIMAESYVTAAVAGILLLLIVIPLMMIISGQFNEIFLYILIFMVVPLIHIGFAFVIRMIGQGA